MHDRITNRTKWLHVRLTPDEYTSLQGRFRRTTCRKLSDYARKLLLGKAVVATYRNRSLDDFMTEMIALRTELHGTSNHFNQAVKTLHGLAQIPELRTWIHTCELEKQTLETKVEEIKNAINKIADHWLQ